MHIDAAYVRSLHPLEVRVILSYAPGERLSAARLAGELGYKPGQSNQAFSLRKLNGPRASFSN
jgi:hypothetical protein